MADDLLREAELGYAVDQHAAALVERLEDRDAVARLRAVRRAGDGRGAGADDRDLLAGRGSALDGGLGAGLAG